MARIACIVEGHGEVHAVPILVRRIAQEFDPGFSVEVLPPLRVSRSRLVKKDGELERSVELAARKTGGRGAILLLIDSDDDCPAEQGPRILSRARQQRSDLPLAVVLAKREFEAWFLAAAESLVGHRGLRSDLELEFSPSISHFFYYKRTRHDARRVGRFSAGDRAGGGRAGRRRLPRAAGGLRRLA